MRRFRRYTAFHSLSPIRFRIICVAVLGILLVLLADARLRPAVRTVAMTRAQSFAVRIVGESVENFICENSELCSSVANISSYSGTPYAFSVDANAVNLLKSRVVRNIDETLEENRRFKLKIPMGAVTGSELFSGNGPDIPVSVQMTGSARAKITDTFVSAGINQTRHRIMLKVECDIYVFLGGSEGTVTFEDEYCIAENIIIGEVPQTAVNIDIPQK